MILLSETLSKAIKTYQDKWQFDCPTSPMTCLTIHGPTARKPHRWTHQANLAIVSATVCLNRLIRNPNEMILELLGATLMPSVWLIRLP
jgi:hypothetical protein